LSPVYAVTPQQVKEMAKKSGRFTHGSRPVAPLTLPLSPLRGERVCYFVSAAELRKPGEEEDPRNPLSPLRGERVRVRGGGYLRFAVAHAGFFFSALR
jgi:hypothetical protein